MSYTKTYSRINWENEPSVNTPINETNLNAMDYSLDAVDTACQALDTAKAEQTDLLLCVKGIDYNTTTGVFTFTWQNGTTSTVDLNIEKIPVSFSMDANGVITMTTTDGTTYTADIGSLIKTYTFTDSSIIDFTVTTDASGNKTITASIIDGSITEDKLQPNFLADVKVEVTKAENAATAAEISKVNSEAYAVGERSGVPVTSGDVAYHNNSKYYSEEAASSASNASTSATNASTYASNASGSAGSASTSATNANNSALKAEGYAVGKQNGTDVSSGEYYENNAKYFSQQASSSANTASTKAGDASTSANNASASASTASTKAGEASTSANNASTSATNAANAASDAEAYGAGTRNGQPVPSTDPAYHNNAKYYSEQAAGKSFAALEDVDINTSTLANGQVPKYNSQTQKWENGDLDISNKADKVTSATSGNFAGLDSNGNLTDSGKKPSDFLTQHQDISGKADKVSGATANNFAGLNASGNPIDSGMKIPTVLTQTLTSPNTQVTFQNAAITANARIRVFTNVPGLNYESIDASTANTIVLTYEAQNSDISVQLVIE